MFHCTCFEGRFNQTQGELLIKLARQTIKEHLALMVCDDNLETLAAACNARVFQDRRGVFICLKLDGRLRGCIGSVEAVESIVDGVMNNAVKAAFSDSRFTPLSVDELAQLTIEVSVLSEPQPLEYSNSTDLLAKLQVGVDGVIIRQGALSATFLPQVWKQLSTPEDFLSHLCLKAGLSADCWQKTMLDISIYQVQYFVEEKSDGLPETG